MRHGGAAMFEILDRRTSLTGNQIKILTAAIIGDALEFFDYFLIGFVLAFLIGPWKLTFGQSAVVLMSSGIGDRKSTRLNSSHTVISYAVFCLKKKKTKHTRKTPARYKITSVLCASV